MKYLFFLAIALVGSCNSNSERAIQSNEPNIILTGADQTALYFPTLEDKNIAMVVNHTSMLGDTHLVDTLLTHGIKIKTVFAPEHGFRGDADAGEQVESGMDISTGLSVISLYGKDKKPSPEHLQGVDLVVFDIQDVGARFYTYISTMHYVMEACAELGIPFMVLDRPNPNGDYIDGPVRQEGFESFVGKHPIPVVHGLTVGELAQMINGEGWLENNLKCDLTIIPVKNYDHSMPYTLPIKPSPNLPNQRAVLLYPTICFFEGTVMSVGRGTHKPFQVLGYPDSTFGEFSFVPVSIEGMSKYPKYEEQTCFGIDLREGKNLREIDLSYLIDFLARFEDPSDFFNNYFNTLAGTDQLRAQLENGMTEDEIKASWQPELDEYKLMRNNYLLYPDFE